MADQSQGYGKALAAGASGALVTILAWVLDQFFHVQIPVEVAASFQTVIVGAFVYFTPHSVANGGNQ